MIFNKIATTLILISALPRLLIALPQNLDTFYDFENVSGEGAEFIIGEYPNSIRVIGFTLEEVPSPTLAHSGTRSLVLAAGVEGKILFAHGVNQLQFYAAESSGGGRIELRDRNFETLSPNGLVIGLPTTISPDGNPQFQSFVAYSGDFLDASDLNFTNEITEIKVINVNGVFALDDLGFTFVDGPPNNTVYEDFEKRANNPVFADPTDFTLGQSPISANFTGGFAGTSGRESFNHTFPPIRFIPEEFVSGGSWIVSNDNPGTITFETPAAQVQFYAAVVVEGEGEIKVFDTNDNLLTSTTDIPRNIEITSGVPLTFFDFNAAALGAPDGIGKVTYTRNPGMETNQGDIDDIVIDDFGFTPIANFEPPTTIPLILEGSGDVAGEDIQHPSGNIFDQVLLTGQNIKLQAKPDQITRVSFMDKDEDIVQVEFSGSGTLAVNLDPATFLPPALPPRYNQEVMYVTGISPACLSRGLIPARSLVYSLSGQLTP